MTNPINKNNVVPLKGFTSVVSADEGVSVKASAPKSDNYSSVVAGKNKLAQANSRKIGGAWLTQSGTKNLLARKAEQVRDMGIAATSATKSAERNKMVSRFESARDEFFAEVKSQYPKLYAATVDAVAQHKLGDKSPDAKLEILYMMLNRGLEDRGQPNFTA